MRLHSERERRRAKEREAQEIAKAFEWIPKAFEAAIFNTADDDAFEYAAIFKRCNAAWQKQCQWWNGLKRVTKMDPKWFFETYSEKAGIEKAKVAA